MYQSQYFNFFLDRFCVLGRNHNHVKADLHSNSLLCSIFCCVLFYELDCYVLPCTYMCGDYKEKKAVFTERDIPVGYVSIITMYIVFMNS